MLALVSGESAQSFSPNKEQITAPASANQPESILSVAAEVSDPSATRAIPKMMSELMSGMMQNMMSQMETAGCDPAEM